MGSKKQFAVLGLGRFGLSAARTLEEMGVEVLGVDMDVNLTEYGEDGAFQGEIVHQKNGGA